MNTRARGRPALKDDAILQAVAMKLVRKEAPSPRSAIAQALPKEPIGASLDGDMRRLQRKWHQKGTALLAEAEATLLRQERERAERERCVNGLLGLSPEALAGLATLSNRFAVLESQLAATTQPIVDALAAQREALALDPATTELAAAARELAASIERVNMQMSLPAHAQAQLESSSEAMRRALEGPAETMRRALLSLDDLWGRTAQG